jgi:hypothetical protein
LLVGEVRVVLLKDIADTVPDRTWKKGDEVLACVANDGKVYIPLDDDALNGTYFNDASEYRVIGPVATGWDTPAAKAAVEAARAKQLPVDSASSDKTSMPWGIANADENDPRLDIDLEDTPLTKAMVANLANGDVYTVRDFVICWREDALKEIPKFGKAKIAKAEEVIAEFWRKGI